MINPKCIEQETVERYGGIVEFVPRIRDYSTTNFAKKIVAYFKWLDKMGYKLNKTGNIIQIK